MKQALLTFNKRKICLKNCGYDKSMITALQRNKIDGKLILPVEKIEQMIKEAFPKRFSSHNHKCKITQWIELL